MTEVTARTGVPGDQSVESSRLNRAVDALRTQETFTREQVSWLMSQAMRWGYEDRRADDADLFWAGYDARAAEENEWAADVVASFSAKDVADGLSRKWLSEQADAAARLPRPGDYKGGPLVWDEPAAQSAVAA